MTGSARVIHEDEHILVVHRAGSSPFTLVTFGGMGQRPSGTWIWAQPPVDALDLDAVGFLGKTPNWYPAEAMRRAAPAVRAALRGQALGYGYSMGGYAALKYGRLLGLDGALAVAPQVSIDPADMPRDLRYHGFFDPALHAGMQVRPDDLCRGAVILADPRFLLDRMHAAAPAIRGRGHRIWLPYMRHGVIQALTGTGIFGEVLDRLRAGDVAGIRALIRARRRGARAWHETLAAAAMVRGRTDMAEALWRRAEALGSAPGAIQEQRRVAEQDRDRLFPVVWRPPVLRRMTGRLLAQARAGNSHEVIRSAGRLPRVAGMPRLAVAATNAAIDLRDASAVDEAASMAIVGDLPRQARNIVTDRLAVTGHGLQALAVLLADPALAHDRAAWSPAVPLFGKILRDPGLPPVWQALACALRRRLIGAAEPEALAAPPPEASPFAFAFAPPAPPAGEPPRLRLLTAPRLRPAVAEEFRAVLAAPAARCAGTMRPGVALLRDVFVNARGQVWDREGRLYRSLGRPIPEASLAAMAAAPELPEAAFGVEPNRNFYHWVIDTLTGLAWRLDRGAEGMPVLLREDAPSYAAEALEIAAGGPVPVARAGAAVLVRRLHLGGAGLRHLDPRGAHATLIARLAEAARNEAVPPAPRLYLSRRDSQARRLLNEEELEDALAARGFLCTTFGGLPLRRQIAMLRGAEVIAGPHGAGLSHLLFCEPGRQVFEFLPAAPGQLELRACFLTLSRLRGHHHAVWLEPFNETFGEWRVDLEAALPALDAFIEGGGAGAEAAA